MATQVSGWRTFAGVAFYLVGAFNVIGGLALASLSGMLHIAFLVAFPAFGLIAIALSILVVYGLIVPDDRTA
jgi:hypothetical protein